jgi:hypothetical protein
MRAATPLLDELKDESGKPVGAAKKAYLVRRVEMINELLDGYFAAGNAALQQAQ